MGRGRNKSKNKSKAKAKPKKLSGAEKAKAMAKKNIAKHGGTASAARANKASMKAKAKSYTKTSGAATAAAKNKASMQAKAKAKHTASQAAKKAAPSKGASISKGTTGIGPVKSGSTYSKALSNATNAPSKKTSGIGPVADGATYAAALKASPPKFKEGTKVASHDKPLFKSVPAKLDEPASDFYKKGLLQQNINPSTMKDLYGVGTKTAMLGGDNLGGPAAVIGGLGTMTIMGANAIKNLYQNTVPKFREQIEQRVNPDADKISAVGDIGGLGISPATTAPSYFSIKSSESFGAPSQEAVDKAAGIAAGGLNIGGSGFTPSSPSGGSTSRAISDGASKVSFGPVRDGATYAKNITDFGMRFGATPEARGKAYEQSLDPNSFKGLSDGQTFGVGPVASGDAYARGLNTDNQNVENRLRQVRNLGSTLTGGLIPPVRKLADKEIADRRIKNAAFRQANLVGRKRGSGGARLPVAPLTPEEILLPEVAAAQQTGPAYQQALPEQTGVDPNRLLQIQQEAYQQAFNPYNPLTVGGFNPFFRFFNRRGGSRRGSFRRAFRRD